MTKSNGVKAWSLSALQLYESCPARYKAEKIDKIIPFEKSPAMDRGIAIHAKGEHYLRGNIPSVPPEYKDFKREMNNLKKFGAAPEKKLGFTKDWKQTGYLSTDTWLRIVVDAELSLEEDSVLVVDFKTGKVYRSNEDQSNLYATCYLHNGFKIVDAEFWYLDQDTIVPYTYKGGREKHMRKKWEDRVAPLFSEVKWLPTPSELGCRWCKHPNCEARV